VTSERTEGIVYVSSISYDVRPGITSRLFDTTSELTTVVLVAVGELNVLLVPELISVKSSSMSGVKRMTLTPELRN